jgi:hypothetical protein
MDAMRESWTDERLDDMKAEAAERGRRMELGFAEARTELKHEAGVLRTEIGALRTEVGTETGVLRTEMREEFGSLHERFDRLQQTMIYLSGVMIAALIGVIATQL